MAPWGPERVTIARRQQVRDGPGRRRSGRQKGAPSVCKLIMPLLVLASLILIAVITESPKT